MTFDVCIVGAGFAGAVCARELTDAGRSVLVVDKRPHIGGNAYDCIDDHGVRVHRYGPHIFHTNSRRIWEYVSRFTAWRPYEHRVLAVVDGVAYPFPINRQTIWRLYGVEADAYLAAARVDRQIANSEDAVLAAVGHDLCDKFFRGYTRKQWGLELSELSASVAARIPVRTNDDDRYFTDTYQAMPADGYEPMFRRLLDGVPVELGTPFEGLQARYRHLIYTGPIDAYFGHCFGRLPYRSLRFEHDYLNMAQYQPVATVNWPNDHAYTRVTEFRHLTGQEHSGTSIVREYPQADGDPFYPIPRAENEAMYRQYRDLAKSEGVTFVGRLAEYRYYNMDQAIGAALACVRNL